MFHYTVKDGLPSKEVHFIFEDSNKYIWICTDAGLVKYNANTFKVFDSSVGMPDNTIFEVLEDQQHRIWFRTLSGGIGYILNDSVHTLPANDRIIDIQNKGLLISFYVENDGTVIIGKQGSDECVFIQVRPPYTNKNVTKLEFEKIENGGLSAIKFNDKVIFAEKRKVFLMSRFNHIIMCIFITEVES